MALQKSLGQHFLNNQKAINDIVAALGVEAGDVIIEIGPGAGAITKPLAELCTRLGARLYAIEKDTKLVIDIQHSVPLLAGNVEHGDALEILPSLVQKIQSDKYKIVGNIPYYITGHLLRVIGELEHKPTKTILMIQKEVAERVSAQAPEPLSRPFSAPRQQSDVTGTRSDDKTVALPRLGESDKVSDASDAVPSGSDLFAHPQRYASESMTPSSDSSPSLAAKTNEHGTRAGKGARKGSMNLLAAATQYWGEVKTLFSLKPKDFTPPPEVSSAVISIISRPEAPKTALNQDYYRFIKAAFKQPRKTLLNNLSEAFNDLSREKIADFLAQAGLPPTVRPQDLSVEQLTALAASFKAAESA